ncbi:MAG: hypothetical protein HQK51_10820 [Oligoflexia bacterium]|nr:hypothetical protein [Oligoflexia bacterium]
MATYVERATSIDLTTYSQIQNITDEELKIKIFHSNGDIDGLSCNIDFEYINKEMKPKFVTLKLFQHWQGQCFTYPKINFKKIIDVFG